MTALSVTREDGDKEMKLTIENIQYSDKLRVVISKTEEQTVVDAIVSERGFRDFKLLVSRQCQDVCRRIDSKKESHCASQNGSNELDYQNKEVEDCRFVPKIVIKLPHKKRAYIKESYPEQVNSVTNSFTGSFISSAESFCYPVGSFVMSKAENKGKRMERPKRIYRVGETELQVYKRVAQGYQQDYLDVEGYKNIKLFDSDSNDFVPVAVQNSQGLIVQLANIDF